MVLKLKRLNKFPFLNEALKRRAVPVAIAKLIIVLSFATLAPVASVAPVLAQSPAVELDPARPLLSHPSNQEQHPPLRRSPVRPGAGFGHVQTHQRNSQFQPQRNSNAPVHLPQGTDLRQGSPIESGDLDPIRSEEGTGLPIGVWQGLDGASLERLFAKLDLPPRSPTLNRLLLRLLTSPGAGSAGRSGTKLNVLRLEALFRSGHFKEILNIPDEQGVDGPGRHMAAFIKAKAELGLGQAKAACERLKNAGPSGTGMPKGLAVELLKMTIYCRAQAGDINGANLVVDLAREGGIGSTYATKAVLALEAKRKSAPKLPAKVDLIDYSLTALFPKAHLGDLIEKADAPVLAAMLIDRRQPQDAYLKIAERSFKLNIIGPQEMARIYKNVRFNPGELNDPIRALGRYKLRPEGRALLYQAAEYQRDPMRRANLMTRMMKSAMTKGYYGHIAKLLKPALDHIPQSNEFIGFAEMAIEIALATGEYEKALSWAIFASTGGSVSPSNYLNWLTLIDIGAPENVVPNGSGLAATQEVALAGRFSPATLHRLVTVLDALKYDVPIGLWNRASASPQPSSGHLPDTGILPQLEAAARNNQYGKVILYSMIALGKDGPRGAHMIALGDTIKALAAAGMKNEARQIGLEALFAIWPRSVGH